ncbi:MAG: hypothetical protein ACE5KE_07600 [Methanosarcinales archaeon]
MTELAYWKKVPLNNSASILVDYWNYLHRRVNGMQVDDMNDALKTILLGGVTSNGEYYAE